MTITYANLLAIDADEDRIKLLTDTMKQQGWYAVTTCTNAHTALFLLSSKLFDAILIDVHEASSNEFEFLKRTRIDPRYNQVPIIILAEIGEYDLVTACLEQGATDYLRVPTNHILLKTRLSTHLQQREIRSQALSCLDAFNSMKKLADDLREIILPLGIALSSENSFDILLERIVEEAQQICNADAGILYLRTGDKLDFVILRVSSLNLAYGGANNPPIPFAPLPLYDSAGNANHSQVAAYVALEGVTINIPDIYNTDDFDFSAAYSFDKVNQYRSLSCLTVSLKKDEVIGVLQLINAKSPEGEQVTPFLVYHKLVTESLAAQAAVVLHNHVLRERQKELLYAEQELQIGHQVQSAFLPKEIPQPPGWDIAFYFEPSRLVAGDFYDAFHLPNNKIALVIADVCDKGMGAAIFMAQIRSLLRAFIDQHYFLVDHKLIAENVQEFEVEEDITSFDPIDYVALYNAMVLTNAHIGSNHGNHNMFVTIFMAFLDPETGEYIYINSGHLPPLVFNNGNLKRRLLPTGPAVGLRPQAQYQIKSGQLASDDILLAYTDGVTEARNMDRELYSLSRLYDVMKKRPLSAANVLLHIVNDVHAHVNLAGQYDDITLLAVQRK